ncbi:MAG: protein kinase domain-containing protein, partial [Pyrinomonadaceae bacterium]
QEAKAASALNHPNILTVYEVGEVDGKNYIATELIDGRTLRDQISSKNSLELNQILKIGVQVSEALSAAHHAGIIHRDIKPENIMIRKDGYAKVLDFGLAKLSEQPATASGEDATRVQVNTTPGMVMGTVSYMSPEQARGKATDARTDIWSLGVVLYEMLAGKQPFMGETANHTIVSILEKEPLLLEHVPDELQRIVRKSLTKDVEMRYQSAHDLLIDLKNLRRDLDIKGELERSVVPNRETASETSSENATQFYSGDAERTRSGQSAATQSITTSSSSLEYAVTQAKSHKLATAIAALVLVAMIGAGGYFAFVRGASKQISSIAVMPFVNGTGNPDNEYLSDGMTETLISSLSQIPNLNVKARSSVFRYKGKDTDAKTIGKELGVQAILNGRVVQHGDQLDLSLELIDTSTENVLWSEQYDRRQADLVTLQSEIARDVSQKLQSKLSGADEQKIAKAYTADPEAYQLYLKGIFYWNKRTPDSLKKSVEYFNQAVAKDPGYGRAYAGLSLAYVLLPEYFACTPQDCYPKAIAAARRALELDGTLAEAHAALGLAFTDQFKFADARQEFQQAIKLNPNYATAHQWYADNLCVTGRFDEAIAEAKRALELDPLSLIINENLAEFYGYAGQYDKAIEQEKAALEIDPNFAIAHSDTGTAYEMKGMYAEALAEYKRNQELNADPNYYLPYIGHLYGITGKRDEAQKVLDQMKEIAAKGSVTPYS